MAVDALRFRGLWEDEMFARQGQNRRQGGGFEKVKRGRAHRDLPGLERGECPRFCREAACVIGPLHSDKPRLANACSATRRRHGDHGLE